MTVNLGVVVGVVVVAEAVPLAAAVSGMAETALVGSVIGMACRVVTAAVARVMEVASSTHRPTPAMRTASRMPRRLPAPSC